MTWPDLADLVGLCIHLARDSPPTTTTTSSSSRRRYISLSPTKPISLLLTGFHHFLIILTWLSNVIITLCLESWFREANVRYSSWYRFVSGTRFTSYQKQVWSKSMYSHASWALTDLEFFLMRLSIRANV